MPQKTRRLNVVFLVVGLLCLMVGWVGLRDAPLRAAPSAAPPAAGGPVALVGQVGGISHAVATLGHFVYLGMGSQVAVLNVEDPSRPVFVGSIVLPGIVKDIYAHNGLAIYVAAGEGGLYQLSVTGSTSLIVAGSYDTTDAQEVLRHGDLIYLADGEGGLLILEDEAGSFRVVGSFDTNGPATAVAVQNQYLFVTDRGFDAPDGSVHILDVQDPARPVEIGTLGTAVGWIHDIELWGHYAYITMTQGGIPDWLSVEVIDFSDPTTPRWVGEGSTLGYGLHARLLTTENRLYVVEDEGKITVFEREGATLTPLGSFATPGTSTDLTVRFDGLAFVADGPRGLTVANVQEPSAIEKVGSYETGGYVVDVALHGEHLYLADRGVYLDELSYVRGGLKVVDASRPTAPRVVRYGGVPANGLPLASGSVMGVTLEGNSLYIAGGACGGRASQCTYRVHGLDITDPAAPAFVAELSTEGLRRPNRLAATEDYLYIAAPTLFETGVDILPLPGFGGGVHYPLPAATDIALAPPYAYVVSRDGAGLRILDISNPLTATEVAAFMPTSDFEGVTVAGGHAFLAGGAAGVTIVDVSNPFSPTLVSQYDTPGNAQYVVVYDSLALVADGWAGLHVLDISDPAAPTPSGGYDTPGDAVTLRADERYVYVADGEAGLSILQVGFLARGRVADSLGEPVAGVTIRTGSALTLTTDADGGFARGYILSEAVRVTAEQEGYQFVPSVYTITAGIEPPFLHFTRIAASTSVTLEPGMASELTYTDTQGLPTTLAFPANAVTTTTTLWLTPTLASNYGTMDFANHAFDLYPTLTFAAPVTVTLRYSDADVAQMTDEGTLWLGWWNGTGWQEASTTCTPATPPTVDPATNTLTLRVCRSGRFALFGPTSQRWLPLLSSEANGG